MENYVALLGRKNQVLSITHTDSIAEIFQDVERSFPDIYKVRTLSDEESESIRQKHLRLSGEIEARLKKM